MSDAGVIPGAEPLDVAGDDVGVLVLHGFTGNPGSIRPLAEAFAADGRTVVAPRLPGHGTVVEDMLDTRWSDWSAAADAAYADLAARTRLTVVAGLSMGGTLACRLAADHPEVAGLVAVNPLVHPPDAEMVAMGKAMIDAGETVAPGIGSDIADPDAHETAYPGSPLQPLLSLVEGVEALQADLPRIACPVLLLTSAQDHVVPPVNSDHLASVVAGPVERVALERSYHVATLDFDKDLIAERAVAFVRKLAASS
jgi:carboxylesterase